ncbi:PRA1 family protein A1-like isoform X1 [Zingiber officinale]|uniref:PRA1 family protein A1-like isoform X1 n=1 Tax=Zingiber officinale TaxID=94328 RepID=UPI001C4A93B0|nr:PRA1 family protein A1-like isoform X1 [Zingiber officinale]
MDWRSVTAEDLFNALREVEWSSPSRSILEFFSRFTVLRSYSKWSNRLKCNLYYYRTNYFILIFFVLAVGFLLKPLDVVAAFLTGLSNAFLNDRFSSMFIIQESNVFYTGEKRVHCLSQIFGYQSKKCKHLSKKYLQCRMERDLMAKQDLLELGFHNATTNLSEKPLIPHLR